MVLLGNYNFVLPDWTDDPHAVEMNITVVKDQLTRLINTVLHRSPSMLQKALSTAISSSATVVLRPALTEWEAPQGLTLKSMPTNGIDLLERSFDERKYRFEGFGEAYPRHCSNVLLRDLSEDTDRQGTQHCQQLSGDGNGLGAHNHEEV